MNISVFGNGAADLTHGQYSLVIGSDGTFQGDYDIGTLSVGGGSGTGRFTSIVSPLEAIKSRAQSYSTRTPDEPGHRVSHPAHWRIHNISTSTRHIATTMDWIETAIDTMELCEPGALFSYRAVAKRFGVDRTTLSRRHKGLTQSNEAAHEQQQLLNPQQEHELVLHIERRTRRGLPPTREIVQHFAEAIVKCSVSERWVSRFLHRHAYELTIKWSAGIDRNRHQANSEER
ncbi:HTH Tnp Tc5 domain containing protein [Pyrenophora teres f. teres]|uniref:HTH Tnp Tc5 domain containing protein n=1 Tax=Pyrenophora teres f. teres TaxID=97479 RepID=A0A6S6VVC2_9PLEO|nr:HTH Tnp Tc5 domain containing protein [Pyrenophora teres f. teres]